MGVRGGGWVARIARVALAAGLAAAVLAPVPAAAQAAVDYDFDNDGLIEVGSLEQLDAIRWDLDGDGGSPTDAGYATAFPNPAAGMGCPDTDSDANSPNCLGYELSAGLDFDSNNDLIVDSRDIFGGNWSPIGDGSDDSNKFDAVFEGNGKVLSNMRVRAPSNYFGLFGYVGDSGVVRKLGLQGVDVASGGRFRGETHGGALAGALDGRVESVYSTGRVDANSYVGGLVGYLGGVIAGSYSSASVVAGTPGYAGGLAGRITTGTSGKLVGVVAGYATGRVSFRSEADPQRAGGLVGVAEPWSSGAVVIEASYSRGVVPFETLRQGLVGDLYYTQNLGGMLGQKNSEVTVTDSYWDTDASQSPTRSAGGDGKTTTELKTPTDYAGIYANWDVDVDNADGDNDRTTGGDSPWDFGTSGQYPALKVDFDGDGAATVAEFGSQIRSGVDYDTDDDRLIEVGSLAQLDAIRWDLDGDGGSTDAGYATAFPNAAAGMGCPTTAADADDDDCGGYELSTDLDFDSNNDLIVDSRDAFGGNWSPIGDGSNEFEAVFEGNGKVLSNMRVRAPSDHFGLFGYVGDSGVVRKLGLQGVDVASGGRHRSQNYGGALAGFLTGRVESVYSTGRVDAYSYVGGLVGSLGGVIVGSYSSASVVAGVPGYAGGLAGRITNGTSGKLVGVVAGYATGRVSFRSGADPARAGGLVGTAEPSSPAAVVIVASYSRGVVPVETLCCDLVGDAYYNDQLGGMLGQADSGVTVTDSYWDTEASQSPRGYGGDGKTTTELKTPTGYAGIYANWDVDLDNADGDNDRTTGGDSPWDFGTSGQYPALKADFDGDGAATVGEFGSQIRSGVDYDTDDDRLIEVRSLAQLDAMRWDLDGDGGSPTDAGYATAFPNAATGMGCPTTAADADDDDCGGYELSAGLDFDSDDDGDVDSDDAFSGDWTPIGDDSNKFEAVFEGNGKVLSNLRIRPSSGDFGLFGYVGSGGVVRRLGLEGVDISSTSQNNGGAAAGRLSGGRLEGVHAAGSVRGSGAVGGLVGYIDGHAGSSQVVRSYANVAVRAFIEAGGLVGKAESHDSAAVVLVAGSYATGRVQGDSQAGGLIGRVKRNSGALTVRAVYSRGQVPDETPASTSSALYYRNDFGGLIGVNGDRFGSAATVEHAYWDEETSRSTRTLFHQDGGAAKTSQELKSPVGYAGIYQDWDGDLDGDGIDDDWWDFGTARHYPVLKADFDGDGSPTAGEFGSQIRFIPVDYDLDGDGLIEISDLGRLNAMRWDLDGDGAPRTDKSADYGQAFADPAPGMGCPDTDSDANSANCLGYELSADLDFDTDGDNDVDAGDDYPSWVPIGTTDAAVCVARGDAPDAATAAADMSVCHFRTAFEGNGRVLENLRIVGSGDDVGLFGATLAGSVVRGVGLLDADVAGDTEVGALVGNAKGAVEASFSTGRVAGSSRVGGLVGLLRGSLRAGFSYSDVSGAPGGSRIGGLVGHNDAGAVLASYATGSVSGAAEAGGLVGGNGGVVRASYSTGKVAASGPAQARGAVGALVGAASAGGTAVDSYWDVWTSGLFHSAGGVGHTSPELTTPAGYTGIYSAWNIDIDADSAADDPWIVFPGIYPVLQWDLDGDGSTSSTEFQSQRNIQERTAPTRDDYDRDDDGLIDVGSVAQLDAIRWDLGGDGAVDGTGDDGPVAAGSVDGHAAAFPRAQPHMGCPDTDGDAATSDCEGYELVEDLDFDSNGDGAVDAADHGGAFWNSGRGWTPIGDLASGGFSAVFDGGGHRVSNLFADPLHSDTHRGLFGVIAASGRVRRVALEDVRLIFSPNTSHRGPQRVGALAGQNHGTIESSYSTGEVQARRYVGGLVGVNYGTIAASYSNASVRASWDHAGGLAGANVGSSTQGVGAIRAAYSTGSVWSELGNAGGLAGANIGTGGSDADPASIAYSYSRSPVTSTTGSRGGLVAREISGASSVHSYSSGHPPRPGAGAHKSGAQLKSPTGYTGIYAHWNIDVDNADGDNLDSTGADDPWDFGTSNQYPALKADLNDDGNPTAAEFGPQVRSFNQAPAFAAGGSVTVTVRESAPTGSPAGLPVTADDPDGDTLAHTLGGADAADFAIDSRTGQIRTVGALDHAAKPLYAVTVTASDPSGATATIAVAIAVSTANERPGFAAATAARSRSVRENAPAGTAVGLPVTADDPDLHIPASSERLAYSLAGGAGGFAIDSDTAQIRTTRPLDHETRSSYTVTVTATDTAGLTASALVVITVTDVHELTFDEGRITERRIGAGLPAGTAVGAPVTATGAGLVYSVIFPSARESLFTVNSRTGQLLTKAELALGPRGRDAVYGVVLRARDRRGRSTSIGVSVWATSALTPPTATPPTTTTTTPRTDADPPAFDEGRLTERRTGAGLAAGTAVGAPVTATGFEGRAGLVYSLIYPRPAKSLFTVNWRTGQLFTKAELALGARGRDNVHEVVLRVRDRRGRSTSIGISVWVTSALTPPTTTTTVPPTTTTTVPPTTTTTTPPTTTVPPTTTTTPPRTDAGPPAFDEGRLTERWTGAGLPAGSAVGAPVTATGAGLVYSLIYPRPAKSLFTVNWRTGQLFTKAELALGVRGRDNVHEVVLRVRDRRGRSTSIGISVWVTSP